MTHEEQVNALKKAFDLQTLIIEKQNEFSLLSQERYKEKPKEPVEECGSKPGADAVLPTLHADVVNLLDVAAHVSGHEVVEEQPHVVKFQQVSVL